MEIRAGANYTLLNEALTPTEPGVLVVHAFGGSLSVEVHPYKEVELLSSKIYLNVSATAKAQVGERFTAVFSIVNDNPYNVRLPAYSCFEILYGYAGENMMGQGVYVEWGPDAYIGIEPHSRHVYKMIPFSPSRLGEYVLFFRVDDHETIHSVRIEL